MTTTAFPGLTRTAADLMTRHPRTIGEYVPLGEAAQQLVRLGLRGLPVIDQFGRCIGMFSVSDLARWAARQSQGHSPLPCTCAFQTRHRQPGGAETVECRLEEGACPYQRLSQGPNGQTMIVCTEPNCVPTDWQMVELESAPAVVRDVMSTEVISVAYDAPATEIAKVMLDRHVHRVLVLDIDQRPIGVVSANDLLRLLAYPEMVSTGAVS